MTVEISKMQEAIQFLMIGLRVKVILFRIEPLDIHKPMRRVLDLILFSK
jgi:hypothetical protein